MTDISVLDAVALTVSASPWLTEVRALPIHFSPPSVSHFQRVNNTFATIFSGAVYVFVSNTPGTILLQIWPWWWFILLSAACVCVLLWLLLGKIKDVNEGKAIWPMILHSSLYFVIFCSITLGCGLVKLLETHVHLTGQVVQSDTNKPVKGARVQLFDGESLRLEVQSNQKGSYQTLLSKKLMGNIHDWRLEVIAVGYREKQITLADEVMLMTQWRKIALVPMGEVDQ